VKRHFRHIVAKGHKMNGWNEGNFSLEAFKAEISNLKAEGLILSEEVEPEEEEIFIDQEGHDEN
jgi:hypothetical protein